MHGKVPYKACHIIQPKILLLLIKFQTFRISAGPSSHRVPKLVTLAKMRASITKQQFRRPSLSVSRWDSLLWAEFPRQTHDKFKVSDCNSLLPFWIWPKAYLIQLEPVHWLQQAQDQLPYSAHSNRILLKFAAAENAAFPPFLKTYINMG